jgi:hypothetical protein
MKEVLDDIDPRAVPDRFAAAEHAFGKAPTSLPTISPALRQETVKPRRNSSVSMPDYVWELLREEGFRSKEPQNVVIMRGLKAIGLAIDDADLIDPRKLRYQA